MSAWAFAHPWLTFILALVVLQCVYAVAAEFARRGK